MYSVAQHTDAGGSSFLHDINDALSEL